MQSADSNLVLVLVQFTLVPLVLFFLKQVLPLSHDWLPPGLCDVTSARAFTPSLQRACTHTTHLPSWLLSPGKQASRVEIFRIAPMVPSGFGMCFMSVLGMAGTSPAWCWVWFPSFALLQLLFRKLTNSVPL